MSGISSVVFVRAIPAETNTKQMEERNVQNKLQHVVLCACSVVRDFRTAGRRTEQGAQSSTVYRPCSAANSAGQRQHFGLYQLFRRESSRLESWDWVSRRRPPGV